ncbi:MAG: hypothetical protein HC901_01840 [Bdellovibrionaceae bacterium]|nr:hypothetical protein [Pseudobdellovibrionaceae bacterium]
MGVIIDTVADFKDDKIAYSILLTIRDSASNEGDVAQKAISTFKTRELMLSGVAIPGSTIDARLDEHTTLTISLERMSPGGESVTGKPR